MKRTFSILLSLTCLIAFIGIANAGGPPGGTIWADGTAYRTVATPTHLPNHGPKDGIYAFDGLNGQNAVSEAKPGDKDYNGGRWQVTVLGYTDAGLAEFDADNNGSADYELTSWEEVEANIALGYLEFKAMGPSFVCPLIRK